LQSGHKDVVTGATGAPGERDWTTEIVPLISAKLKTLGFEVYETDALAQRDPRVVNTDWNLFLAIHYDADIYNDRGGFIDTPDHSVDYVTAESTRIAAALKSIYFTATKIPEKPQRSNANTKFYYMWQYLSANTPCVLIECGIGNRFPEDHDTLFLKKDTVVQAIVDGIGKAFGYEVTPTPGLEERIRNLEMLLEQTETELKSEQKKSLLKDEAIRKAINSLSKII